MYGLNGKGFKKKTYSDIETSIFNYAMELLGDKINLTHSSILGMLYRTVAWEISKSWDELENSVNNMFASKANGTALDDVVSNDGRYRFNGKKARGEITIYGDSGTKIDAGFKVSTKDKLVFETILDAEILEDETINIPIKAIEIGTKYNVEALSITEIVNPIMGVSEVKNLKKISGGTDTESDELLRERHLLAIRLPANGSNKAQYTLWAKDVEGVGGVNVLRATPSPGFVTVVISDTNGDIASEELVQQVADHIEPLHDVNAGLIVKSATAKKIIISIELSISKGYELNTVRLSMLNNIKAYFTKIALTGQYVSYAQIGKIVLATNGVIDYNNLNLDGEVKNIELENTETPILSELNVSVM